MAGRRVRGGEVWLAEDVDEDDRGPMLAGTLSGYWERPDGVVVDVDGLSLERALAWGRERSDVVLVRIGGLPEYFSLGPDQPEDAWAPPWTGEITSLARRRLPGFEALDARPGDPEVVWQASCTIHLHDPRRLGDVAAALRDDDEVLAVDINAEPEATRAKGPSYAPLGDLTVRVMADTLEQAMDRVEARAYAAAALAGDGEDLLLRDWPPVVVYDPMPAANGT